MLMVVETMMVMVVLVVEMKAIVVMIVAKTMVVLLWVTQRFVEGWKVVVEGFLNVLAHHSLPWGIDISGGVGG